MDSIRKCSHFIGYYNQMMSNFGHLNPESVVTLFKYDSCSFSDSFPWKYITDGFEKSCHIKHQFILRDIKFLQRLLQSPNYIVRQ